MSKYTRILYHIIFSTKYRNRTLTTSKRDVLYDYIFGVLKNKGCYGFCIGGVEDHIHLLSDLKTDVSLSELIKDIKISTSSFIKENNLFENFDGWQDGYAAFTYSINEKENVINYIKNQEEHHKTKSFKDELIDFLKKFEIKYDEKYL
ncbi:MAG TPA: IS200/IS605 family transposase [bacterium]|nr:IS200/IS605 family transposase [bacterium]